MTRLFQIAVLCLLASISPTAARAQATSLWDLNTSVMMLHADGRSLLFHYQQPRISLQEDGVVPGTLHFSGTVTGTTIAGTAHVFSRRCGPQPYHVTGTSSDDARVITLHGSAPSAFDAGCRPVRFRDAILVFNLLQVLPPAPPPVVVGSIDREHAAAKHELQNIQQQRDQEERRLVELRAFSTQLAACQKFETGSCQLALRSPHVTPQDTANLNRWRDIAETFRADRDGCRSGSVAACDAALTSPALPEHQRALIGAWRTAATPPHPILAALKTYAEISFNALGEAIAVVRNLPTSTHVAGGMATILTIAFAILALRHRRAMATPGPRTDADAVAASEPPGRSQQPRNAQPFAQLFGVSGAASAKPPGSPPTPDQPTGSPPAVRDTPAALAALELAYAYLQEVREANRPAFDDIDTRKQHLNTLALASKQLDAAQKLDPDAILEGQDDNEIPYRFTINELKAEALLLEGTTHQTYDTKRAIPALHKATTFNPNNASAFYVLGLTHLANMNKADAVAAFERAVALDPKNITYRKELNRAQSLTASEIAAYKATRVGEKVFDAGIKTANAGIMAWNIFAVLWNIVTFPLRVVFGIFRLLGLHGFR